MFATRPTFAFFNVAVYIILIVIGFLTRVLNAYREFRIDLSLLTGILYAFTSTTFCGAGIKVG